MLARLQDQTGHTYRSRWLLFRSANPLLTPMKELPVEAGSSQLSFLSLHRDTVQMLLCVGGTLVGMLLIGLAAYLNRPKRVEGFDPTKAGFILLFILGSLAYFAPLGTLNGDGAVHQAKIWFVAESLRHGILPEWSFFWFGGGIINECYGPLYYVIFAVPMLLLGLTTKWSIALVLLACSAVSIVVALRALAPKYGYFAAALAIACFLFSPARAAAYWFDGTPHRLVIDLICLLYVLYLQAHHADRPPRTLGLYLGLASAACVYFHLQFGGMATAILFSFTVATLTFAERVTLHRTFITCAVGSVVFVAFAGLHYLLYFQLKPDLIADNDSIGMLADKAEWVPNLMTALTWDWDSKTWDVHYVGLFPIAASATSIFLFRTNKLASIVGAFALFLFCLIPFVPRLTVFVPIFFVLPVAAVVHHLELRIRRSSKMSTPSGRRWIAAIVALAALLDLYPSNFQMPYRPGSGDRPVAEELAAMGPSAGRIVVIAPDKQYGNTSADRFGAVPQLGSPSIFGPTFQLSTKMLGYAALVATRAWRDVEQTGAISAAISDQLAMLNVSDALIYRRGGSMRRVAIPNFRAAWRLGSVTCDATPGPLTKLNWDDMRAAGLGEKTFALDNDGEISIDPHQGLVRGVRLDCSNSTILSEISARPPVHPPGPDNVTSVRYNADFSVAEFEIDASQDGAFLLPFGYVRDLRIERDGAAVPIHRTNEWMSVITLPRGHSALHISVPLHQNSLRRVVDALFVIVVLLCILFRRRLGLETHFSSDKARAGYSGTTS